MSEMTEKQFKLYLKDNGIDDQHELYDEMWSEFIFGGRNPNIIVKEVRDTYNRGELQSEPPPPYEEWLSEWEVRENSEQ